MGGAIGGSILVEAGAVQLLCPFLSPDLDLTIVTAAGEELPVGSKGDGAYSF
jgi:hypothetical protein